MNFQQLRFVREAVRNNLNLTEVAAVLYTSQSGVSKQIKDLEDELGIELFVRSGKRLTALTRAGDGAVQIVGRILQETENLRRYASQYAGVDSGRLVIAATHTQARYTLPKVVEEFNRAYPKVTLELHQGTPRQIAAMVSEGDADIGIASEALDAASAVRAFPCFTWSHRVVVPAGHPLLARTPVTLADIAAHPLITYNEQFTGRKCVDAAFRQGGLVPDLRLTAMDADVIKTYVRRGLGIGIVAEMALDDLAQSGLHVLETDGELFGSCTTMLGVRNGVFLPSFAYRFIDMFAPGLQVAPQ
ncbi:LysR substrate-binding domain-containing protein [Pseudoduganella sp. SL102]|uniref:CysB family transcriptional regulator n=1 Tax=Pseudoduganella albidiflava TaxID=321983 RepID=A0A411WXM0_9BURK|nr:MULTISPECIES: LysR substrate-binding domain-containing protein [Pseudoduganella]QBI01444.1 LysR family transcriptional regulator [Pseudoduganella albidiflava]WBS00415.1 LysR substrate-binding domain-containing protein [Pseudoduganella sp. SL102]GGY35655.1 CysB family transcriptional regulator [Pseudoduganella albidiflava]